MPSINPLNLSDADFAALGSPTELPEEKPVEKSAEDLAAEQAAADQAAADAAAAAEKEKEVDPPVEETEAEKAARLEGEEEEKTEPTEEEKAEAAKVEKEGKEKAETPPALVDPKAKPSPDNKTKVEETPKEGETQTIDYEAAYKEIMKPFKANGKMIELKSPQELIQLAQMGANYTRKLQELQPSRKLLMMLENHDLLDEGKLSYLIDLSKKNPDAIKKLVKDAGLNPLEMDVEAESNYQPGNHRVTDDEANFQAALEDIRSKPNGQEALVRLNSEWDSASKEVLWAKPELFAVMHSQIENGIYDRIKTEVDRRRTLGAVPANVSFLQAYKLVGDELAAANAFADLVPPASTQVTKTPVAKTVATPKPVVKNEAQAQAAAATRTSAKTVTKIVNPLAMSDEEFLTKMAGRI